jgi:hypothetical protein
MRKDLFLHERRDARRIARLEAFVVSKGFDDLVGDPAQQSVGRRIPGDRGNVDHERPERRGEEDEGTAGGLDHGSAPRSCKRPPGARAHLGGGDGVGPAARIGRQDQHGGPQLHPGFILMPTRYSRNGDNPHFTVGLLLLLRSGLGKL